MTKKHNKLILKTLISIFAIVMAFSSTTLIYATSGGGGTGGGIGTTCTAPNAYTRVCGDGGSDGGGAGWRLFSIADGASGLDFTNYGNILDTSYDYRSEALDRCAYSGWFVSFGWDGVNKSYGNQIGPVTRAKGLLSKESNYDYNDYGAISFSDMRQRSNWQNNTKLTEDAAVELYKRTYTWADYSIDRDVGYFCVDPDDFTETTFSGKSTVSVTNSYGTVIGAQSSTGYVNYNASAPTIKLRCNDSKNSSEKCYATFEHALAKTSGEYNSTYYSISDINWGTLSAGSIVPSEWGTITRSYRYNISSGRKICENQSFVIKSGTSEVATTSVCILVPYNFSNTTKVEIPEMVYAGETVSTTTNTSLTVSGYGGYSTNTPSNTSVKLYMVSGGSGLSNSAGEYRISGDNLCQASSITKGQDCRVIDSKTSSFASGTQKMFGGNSYNIQDIAAGQKVCMVMTVYPAKSGTAYGDEFESNNGYTYVSAPSCATVAKKPTFQIWGGSLYTNSGVSTTVSGKRHIKNFTNYDHKNYDGVHIFGSWVEGLVVSNQKVSGIASGAAYGYSANQNGTLIANPGGEFMNRSFNDDYCKRTKLTIPNSDCKSGVTNGAGISATYIPNVAYASVFSALFPEGVKESESVSFNKNTGEGNIYYTHAIGSLTVNEASTIPANTTHIVNVEGALTINNNIYAENEGYTDIYEMPQYIIYARDGIDIGCSVTQINAWLITDGEVNTCRNSDTNSADRSRQLVINGAITANKLSLNRTYGAATGANSIKPAEIINYPTSTVIWSRGGTSMSSTPGLTTAYQRELSPRY